MTNKSDMFDNRTIIVTGAAKGIGRACADAFAAEGAHVVYADIEAPQDLPRHGIAMVCDVGDAAAVRAMIEATIDMRGRIDVMVANAGIVHKAPFLELEEEDFDRVLRVNLKGTYLCVQAAAKAMLAQREKGIDDGLDSIITMSSVNAVLAIPDIAPYVISKGGVAQLTKVAAMSLAPHGIRVNAVGPGSIATDLFTAAVNTNPAALGNVLARTPLGRAGEPAEIASVVKFLAGRESSYITGQTIYADGGRLALNYVMPKNS